MELWYTEDYTKNARFSIKVDRQLYTGQSPYQRIDLLETPEFGRVLVLDGLIMITERDEFIYHDMIVHVPMAVNPDIRKVLVIGGGDGGAVRELTRYPGIEHIDMVEIDEMVVKLCQQYLPQTASQLSDPRVSLHFQDGVAFVRDSAGRYDLIVVDSTDPIGPGEGLFTAGFYRDCYRALGENGILVNQHESPFYQGDAKAMQRAHARIREVFPIHIVYQAHIPTYASGHWLFGFASKSLHPLRDFQADAWAALELKTRYYNLSLHQGAFALPTYVRDLLRQAK